MYITAVFLRRTLRRRSRELENGCGNKPGGDVVSVCVCVQFWFGKNMHSKWKSLVIEMDEFTQNIIENSPESGDLCNTVGDNHHQKPLDAFLWTQTTVWLSVYFFVEGNLRCFFYHNIHQMFEILIFWARWFTFLHLLGDYLIWLYIYI